MSNCSYPAIVCKRYKLCKTCFAYVENRFNCRAPQVICAKPLKCKTCLSLLRKEIKYDFTDYELVKYYNKMYNPCKDIKDFEKRKNALDFYYNKGYTCCSMYFKYEYQLKSHIDSHEELFVDFNMDSMPQTPPNIFDSCPPSCVEYKKFNNVDFCKNTVYFGNQEIKIQDIFKTDEEIKKCLERKFKCDVDGCDKAYTSQHGLRYHMNNGHKDNIDYNKKYVCKIPKCSNRYKNPGGLKYHLKHAHGINKRN